MGGSGVVRWGLALFLCLAGVATIRGVAAAETTTATSPKVEMTIGADFAPRKLMGAGRRPIAFTVTAAIRSRSVYNLHPPPLEKLILGLDRHSHIDSRGLPRCGGGPSLAAYRSLAEIKASCEDAIVGGGRAGIEVLFTESLIPAATDLVIFNGEAGMGRTTLYAVGELTAPIIALVTMPIEIRSKPNGRIGTEAIVTIPKIAGGWASLTDLRLTLHRRLADPVRADGVVSLACPDGRFLVRVRARFPEGGPVEAEMPGRCRRKAKLAR